VEKGREGGVLWLVWGGVCVGWCDVRCYRSLCVMQADFPVWCGVGLCQGDQIGFR
jgi:hypothetical protein